MPEMQLTPQRDVSDIPTHNVAKLREMEPFAFGAHLKAQKS